MHQHVSLANGGSPVGGHLRPENRHMKMCDAADGAALGYQKQVCEQVCSGVFGPVCEAAKPGILSGMATIDVDSGAASFYRPGCDTPPAQQGPSVQRFGGRSWPKRSVTPEPWGRDVIRNCPVTRYVQ
jgi:hypothetical protein